MKASHLKSFEEAMAGQFLTKKIHCPVHLSGGNEKQLIKIFKNIAPKDYVFSTHRNHYHYLLHTRNWDMLAEQILYKNDSMHTCDVEHNFYSSSIVAGCVAIAVGVALALKLKKDKRKVWCFIGDGATDEGWFYEAVKYAGAQDLPVTYIVEDNNRSVAANKKQRWGKIIYYNYKCGYPHCGTGKWVTF
jgi:pyruvate dehydrogenase E1 component alpha subunit